jgi:hypothetical protein
VEKLRDGLPGNVFYFILPGHVYETGRGLMVNIDPVNNSCLSQIPETKVFEAI